MTHSTALPTPEQVLPASPEAVARLRELAAGIREQDYLLWRHHPVSKLFLAFLEQYRNGLIEGVLRDFLAGTLTLSAEHEARGFIRAIDETANLSFEAIIAAIPEAGSQPAADEGQDNA